MRFRRNIACCTCQCNALVSDIDSFATTYI